MVSTVNIGLGIGCVIIGLLMAFLGVWFMWNGFKDKDWSSVVLSVMIFGVAAFAGVSAYNLFNAGIYVAP